MVAVFSGVLARAKEIAQRRRQALSTAHVLCALYQDDERVRRVCAEGGPTELQLLAALARVHDERHNAVDLAVERARKQAATDGSAADALHLWAAIARDVRSAGAQLLSSMELSAAPFGQAARSLPSDVSAARGSLSAVPLTRAAQRVRPVRDPQPMARSRRARVRTERGFLSSSLAEQTEKLLRRAPGSLETPHALPDASERKTDVAPSAPDVRLPRRASVRVRQVPAQSASSFVLDEKSYPLLSSLGRNLTQAAHAGALDGVIGRDAEIEILLDVLGRRRAGNPVLVGPPGVGKTAVVEGLALALARSAGVQGAALDRVLIELSASSLLAGTGVRGALSERIQALRAEVKKSEGKVLLFIDEIHTVIGGGEGDSLGNELKTALARGEFPVIGATTDAEYRRVFERDAALARRFSRVEIGEPSRKDTLRILQGTAPHYEAHHGVRYDARALSAAVELSVRYLPARQLPDKAIALLDQAGARVHRRGGKVVDEPAIAHVVSELAGVPVERLLMQDSEALLALDAHLAERVVGQPDAVGCIANALRKSAAGFLGARPLGTFLFLGPTGVGKTEMAKAIAERLFPGAPLTRIDMSELSESHATARLFGSPPGYVGHEEGGQLTEAVRHRPYQLVLLDEIEKAHPDVLLALLPLLDEGRLTDGRGRTVDFTNTVIVMTSNLGAESAALRARIGFGEGEARGEPVPDARVRDRALSLARSSLPLELWNRIDEPLCFQPLSENDVMKVARRMLREVAKVALERHEVVFEVETSALLALVAAGGFDRALGARPMRRTISRLVEAPLSRALLAGELHRGEKVVLHAEHGPLEFLQPSRAETAAE